MARDAGDGSPEEQQRRAGLPLRGEGQREGAEESTLLQVGLLIFSVFGLTSYI